MSMSLTPDFNNVEWGADDYCRYSGDITIGLFSVRVSLGMGFLKIPSPEVGHWKNCSNVNFGWRLR